MPKLQELSGLSNPNSQAAGSPNCSPSTVSEPPDIRNWFSSYTYQSPVLDSNEDFIAPQIDEGEFEKRGLYVEDSENEDENNREDLTEVRKTYQSGIYDRITRPIIRKSTEETMKHDCLPVVEAPGCPDSLSLPSELPDIRNWFSSYVYESPALDSTDFDVQLSSHDDFSNTDEFDNGKGENLKELTKIELKDELSFDQEKDCSEQGSLSSKSILYPGKTSDQSDRQVASKNHDIMSDKYVECPRIKAENPMPVLQASLETSRVDCLRSPVKEFTDTGNEGRTENKFIISDNDFGWILPNHKSREPHCKSIRKERYLGRVNGFTSMKKKSSIEINDENSPKQLGPSKCNYDKNVNTVSCSSKGKIGGITREALKEMTNLHRSYGLEIAGKWKCPQKSKPNTGPPLKQLRLERWVHRI